MIDFISSWVEGIAIAVIIASIFELIIPNGNSKKYIKMILGIYIIFSIISPFVNNEELYSFDISEIIDEYVSDSSVSTSSNIADLNEMYIEILEEEIISEIGEQGYEVSTCTVDGTIYSEEDEENISINSLYIKIKSKNDNFDSKSLAENVVDSIIENVEEVNIIVGNTTNTESEISSSDIETLKKYLSDYLEIEEDSINIEY